MSHENTGVPTGGVISEEAESPGTGEIIPAGARNPNKPGIGAMSGNAPNYPGEANVGRDATIIEKRTSKDGPILDETDQGYLSHEAEDALLMDINEDQEALLDELDS